jgi:hypothetical protein
MDLRNLTDEEVSAETRRRCPPELLAKFDQNQGQADDEALVDALTQEMQTALGKQWCDAIGRREFEKEVLRALTEATPITELLSEMPASFRHLQLPYVCSCEILGPINRRLTSWKNATWNEIETQRRILADDRAWDLLDHVQQLCRAVEPLMRDHPARTLAEVMPMLSRQEEEQQ